VILKSFLECPYVRTYIHTLQSPKAVHFTCKQGQRETKRPVVKSSKMQTRH